MARRSFAGPEPRSGEGNHGGKNSGLLLEVRTGPDSKGPSAGIVGKDDLTLAAELGALSVAPGSTSAGLGPWTWPRSRRQPQDP